VGSGQELLELVLDPVGIGHAVLGIVDPRFRAEEC